MIRRRRPVREIAFSFDSFLDVVANVVGIIIRLILVAWVGARSYGTLHVVPGAAVPAAEASAQTELPPDPMQQELERHRRELAAVQARLLEQLRQFQQVKEQEGQVTTQLAALTERKEKLQTQRSILTQATAERGKTKQAAALSLTELRQRGQRLTEEIRSIEKLPPLTKTLHYRTPVSRPVQADELLFECQHGRVAFIDIAALLVEVKRGLEDKGQMLRSRWQISETVGPVGPFRLRYLLERERGTFDALGSGPTPDADATFRYQLSSWEIEPVGLVRGETLEAALAPGSEFRQVADAIDPRQTVVTFWVYPDSFSLYRELRDYLYDRDVVVAGRPLPEGIPITSSRRGSVSRGQ